MALALLRVGQRLATLSSAKKVGKIEVMKRSVMTSRPSLEKVMDELKGNPYFDKYAEKIAKLQQTSPEEFLSRIEEKEQKAREEKVSGSAREWKTEKIPWTMKCSLWKLDKLQRQTIRRNYSNAASKSHYVTTPIFYVNAGPHIGHLYSAVLADAVARYNSMLGCSVLLSTGTDEHGDKVQRAAAAANLPTRDYCAKISKEFKDMCDNFDVRYSDYIRTSEKRHHDAVHHFWNSLKESGHIYLGKYSGWYCVSDETFLTDSQLVEKKNANGETVKVSGESGHPVEWAEEDNYKFGLSKFQDDLRHWLKDERVVQPAKYHKILSNWVEEGACLEDLSISRPAHRVPWGIPVPQDTSHSVYVWLDALVNYLTAVGYPDEKFRKLWPPSLQVLGKDILKFHGVYWPAFLIAAGLEPPKTLLCHSHWTVDGEKMSKSLGNVVSPFEAANTFTEDGLRYFLLREAVPHSDANYSSTKVLRVLNSELADTLGNLVSRCTGKTVNPAGENPHPSQYIDTLNSESAEKVKDSLGSLRTAAQNDYEAFNLHRVVDSVMSTLHSANQMVEHHKPWQLRKETDNAKSVTELKAVISLALEAARISALVLYPIVPRLSTNLLDSLDVPADKRTWVDTMPRYLKDTTARSGRISEGRGVLFRRIKA